jgi:transcriptional regulator with XRE-family HTH domain
MARIKTGKSSAPHFVDAHIGSHIHMRRKFLNMSQETLAKGIGLTFQQIQKYERGTNRVSASTLFYIARFLKMPISYFYEGLGSDETTTGFSESESEQYVSAFLLTTEGIELAKAFPRIRDRKVRQQILALVRVTAESIYGDKNA